MNGQLQIFKNSKFGQVRTLDIKGKTYFVASDVAKALGYSNPSKAINDHCKGVTKRYIPTNGGEQGMNIIPEGDIYRLAAKSELPGAEEFESWVFDIVLPQIRQAGEYRINKPTCIEDVLIQSLQEMKDMRQQLNQVNHNALSAQADANEAKESMQSLRDVMAINHNAWKSEVANLLNRIAKERGGTHEAYQEIRNESYKLLDERAGANLSIRLTNRKRRVLEETGSKSKADKVTKVDVIADDKKLTEVYLAIVKELAIKYKVA